VSLTYRAGPTSSTVGDNLGLLAELRGHWVGSGFNLIARPDKVNDPPFFLELNSTKETLDFTAIAGNIPDRGSLEPDINLHALHYLQQVSDQATDTRLYVETGLWVHVPPTEEPADTEETYVRQASIPHGSSLLAQSTFTDDPDTGPTIGTVDSTPFTGAVPDLNTAPAAPISDPIYLAQFSNAQLPPGLPPSLKTAAVIKNPALLLNKAIENQNITNTVVIAISTEPVGGILNIPFVTQNANAARLDAVFWIEKVQHPIVGEFVQLQYVQRVILDFIGIHWPHISVATLRKQ
jgi:hypothetical protein